jgi:NAD(P)-dependent dehydrogenase (short-subunit alcohol dehydrogenase family)
VCAKSISARQGRPEDLEHTVSPVEALDRRIVAREADVRDAAALREAVDAGVAELGRLDIVCVNAGIWSHGSVGELPAQTWDDVLEVNLRGAWNTVQAAYPHLPDGASIVMVSSTLGLTGAANTAHYGASKHGVVGIMRGPAHGLAPRMITVNTVHPTAVNTPMIHNDTIYRVYRPDLEQPTREDLPNGSNRSPVRERMIPKPGTRKRRRLGIPVVRDRVVQGALKLVLEPIYEADFKPCSYGFRPKRRAHRRSACRGASSRWPPGRSRCHCRP